MPKRKRTYGRRKRPTLRRKRRRTYGGRRSGRVATVRIRNGLTPFPAIYRCKIVYSSAASGTTTGAVTNYNALLGGNTLYDPGQGTGTRQPLGFDQLASIYSKYRVFASKCTVTTWPNANDSTGRLMVTLVPSIDSVPEASGFDYIDQPYAKSRSDTFWYNPGTRLSNFMTTKKMFGQKSLADRGYYASINLDPTLLWYWHLNINAVDGSTMASTNRFMVRVVYWCEFSELVLYAQSSP